MKSLCDELRQPAGTAGRWRRMCRVLVVPISVSFARKSVISSSLRPFLLKKLPRRGYFEARKPYFTEFSGLFWSIYSPFIGLS